MSLAAALLASVSIARPPAIAQSQPAFEVLGDVYQPFGGVIAGPDGALYGTSQAGIGNCGYVYRFDEQTLPVVIHHFPNDQSGGCEPKGELVVGSDGALYGTTSSGGPHSTGTVYRVTPGGAHSIVHAFAPLSAGAHPEGARPTAGLTVGTDGALYGMTSAGGTGERGPFTLGPGVIYRVDPSAPAGSRLTVLRHLSVATDGGAPEGGLTLGSDGNFYGTLKGGGPDLIGTLFRLTPAGGFERIYGFPFGGCGFGCLGGNPIAAPLEADGGFYVLGRDSGPLCSGGSTGQGTVLHVVPNGTPNGVATLVHGFCGPDGSTPDVPLTRGTDGAKYSVTLSGGSSNRGTIYRIAPDGVFSTVHHFTTPFGINPAGRLLERSPGVFIGTTTSGGPTGGTIFRLTFPQPNRAPTAQGGSVTTDEDTGVNGQLIGADADNDPLTYAIASQGGHGTATVNAATGAFTYVPEANYAGNDSFTFTVSDGTEVSSEATVILTIDPVNDAPSAHPASFTTNEDTPLSGQLAATDVDSAPASVTFSIVTNGTLGTATITDVDTGAFTYTPNPNTSGIDGFSFTASDGSLMSNVATISVSITPQNDPPAARTGVVTTTENTAVSGMLQATDPDSGSLMFSVVGVRTKGANVTITDAATGAFTYRPATGAFGYDDFTFSVFDGVNTSTATQMVLIGANSARWPGQTVRVGTELPGLRASGADVGSLSADGRLVAFISDPAMVDEPAGVFVLDRQSGQTMPVSLASDGTQANDSSSRPSLSADGRFVAFSSRASNLVAGDTNGVNDVFVRDLQSGTTVRISVARDGAEPNRASVDPSLSADGRFVVFGSHASNLVPNDTNGVTDVFVHDRVTGSIECVSRAMDGTSANGLALGPSISADGRFVAFYSAASNLVGGDTNTSIDAFVHDRQTGQTTRVSVASDGSQGNPAGFRKAVFRSVVALSADGRFVGFESGASNLVAGDSNGAIDIFVHDRQTGQTTRVNVAADGSQANDESADVWMSADGRFATFTSIATNLVPDDTDSAWDVYVRDLQNGGIRRVSVGLAGAEANQGSEAPAMSADGRFVVFTSPATNLVPDDTDGYDVFVVGGVQVSPQSSAFAASGGDGTTMVTFAYPGTSWTALSHVPWATVTGQSSPDSDGIVTYAVAPNPTGSPRTGTLTVAEQTVTITQGASTAPVAQDAAVTAPEDTSATGTLEATDPNGDPLTFSIVSNGTLGTAVVTNPATGVFTYTPNPNVSGIDTFTFRVNDGTADSNVATVSVTITAVNDAPVAQNGALTVTAGTSAGGTLVASDIDGPSLTYVIVANGTSGTAVVTHPATGTYTYTANPGGAGTDAFTFRGSDGSSDSNVATITVSIAAGANLPPTASPSSITTQEDRSANGTLTASDPERMRLTYTILSNPSRGTVTITNPSTGRFTYVPNPNANGPDSFTFSASDGTSSSNVAAVSVTVTPVNDEPVAAGAPYVTTMNQPISGTLLASDADGDALTYAVARAPRRGTVTIDANTGAFVYTPAANFTGTDSFTFRARDGFSSSAAATVTITVNP